MFYVLFFFMITNHFTSCYIQELRPKGMDVRQDELGDLVDKEMAATSAAIEEAVRRIDVSGVDCTLKCTNITYNGFICDVVECIYCNW